MRRSCLFIVLGLLAVAVLACVSFQLYMSYRGTPPNVIWKFATDDRVPKVRPYKDRVYVTRQNVLYVLDSKSGKTIWQSDKLLGRYVSKIFPSDDITIVISATDPLWTIRIDALDSKNGKLIWSIENLGDGLYGINPFITTHHVYTGDNKNNLLAIDRLTGKVERTIPVGSLVILEPLGINDLVFYVTADGRINAIDDESGRLVWATAIPNAPDLTKSKDNRNIFDAYVTDSILFIWENGGEAFLRAYNGKTGEYLWSSPHVPSHDPAPFYHNGLFYLTRYTTSMSISGNNVSIGEQQFTMYAVDTTTGNLKFKHIYPGWKEVSVNCFL
jgi:outer membrane protein assembly factor BamB